MSVQADVLTLSRENVRLPAFVRLSETSAMGAEQPRPSSSEPLRKEVRNVICRCSDRVSSKVGVASRGLHLRVPKQLADHGQALASRNRN